MASYKYPTDMIGPLKALWYEWYRREMDAPQLPSDDRLELVLEAAYHASFTADERRGTQFRAVFCTEDDAVRALRIEPPRAFAPTEIMRLAPAAYAAKAVLAVDPNGPAPTIWGLCDVGFMQFTLSAQAPGHLHVGRNGRVIVALEDGQIFEENARRGVLQPIIDALSDANKTLWEGVDWPGGAWSPHIIVYPGYVYDMLDAVRQGGHGGAVLVVPDAEWKSSSWRQMVRIKYQCHENSIWPLLRKAVFQYDASVISGERDQSDMLSAEQDAKLLLARLPGLTAVDGALLITDQLRVLGFGVEVLAQAKLDAVVLPGGATRSVEAYGTRHRSAFRFCAAYPRGTAFVCSQDGAIKCIRNQNGQVTLYQ